MLKTLFVLEIFTFLSSLFGYVEKWLDKKAMVNLKTCGVHTAQQIITIRILPNISGSKGNERIRFGQLMEYNKRKNFSSKIMLKMWQGD